MYKHLHTSTHAHLCSLSQPFMHRSHVYDAAEMHSQKVKTSSTSNFELSLVSGSNEMSSTATSKQDIKVDTIKLQDNPAYAATNEFF